MYAVLLIGAVVVLDAGHGGSEAGTERYGHQEKAITLGIARSAAAALRAQGHVVVLTRKDDRILSLERRVELAHRSQADAFVSIHVNASPARSRRGTETYVASVWSNELAESLVAREESQAWAASPEPSLAPGADGIVADLSRQGAHRAAARLAAAVQAAVSALDGAGPGRGLRQAPFYVLRKARVPAILLEAGYLSHPEQAAFLASDAGQEAVGQAVARGIDRFLSR